MGVADVLGEFQRVLRMRSCFIVVADDQLATRQSSQRLTLIPFICVLIREGYGALQVALCFVQISP